MSRETGARWCAVAGLFGILLGLVVGAVALMRPELTLDPAGGYSYASTPARVVAALNGVMVLGFTAAFFGYYLIGAVGDGLLGKVATVLTLVGNLGPALGFFHSALTGEASPLTMLGFLTLPGYLLLTVAALRVKSVSLLYALWPLAVLVILAVLEMGIAMNGFTIMLHQLFYGSIAFVVLAHLRKAPVTLAPAQ